MKTLSTDAAATAIGVDRKTLDNILSREGRQLLREGRRGRSRRIPIPALERILIALILSRDAGMTIAKGLEVAERIIGAAPGPIELGSLATLQFDIAKLRTALERSISDALESVAEPTRGRPRN